MQPFVISTVARDAFVNAHTARANDSLVGYLRKRFPDLLAERPDSEVVKIVQTARISAAQFGIEREDNVATFLDLTLMYPGFPNAPWAHDILASDKLNGPDKIALLRDRVRRQGTEL